MLLWMLKRPCPPLGSKSFTVTLPVHVDCWRKFTLCRPYISRPLVIGPCAKSVAFCSCRRWFRRSCRWFNRNGHDIVILQFALLIVDRGANVVNFHNRRSPLSTSDNKNPKIALRIARIMSHIWAIATQILLCSMGSMVGSQNICHTNRLVPLQNARERNAWENSSLPILKQLPTFFTITLKQWTALAILSDAPTGAQTDHLEDSIWHECNACPTTYSPCPQPTEP